MNISKSHLSNNFNAAVKTLWSLQQSAPLDAIYLYTWTTEGIKDIDAYELYEILTKLKEDFNVITEIMPPSNFEYPYNEKNPFPFLPNDAFGVYNEWIIALSPTFIDWAKRYLGIEPAFYFDKKTNVLEINGIPILLRESEYSTQLCRVIFANKVNISTKWEFAELIDAVDRELGLDEVQLRKTYDALKDLNVRIKQKCKLEKFFVLSMKTVLINRKYL